MIFVTGDCHGEFYKLGSKKFKEQKEMTKDDIVIICGDFGHYHNDIFMDNGFTLLYDEIERIV